MVIEYWKPVIGYEGLYVVSNFCRVKNVQTNKHLKPSNVRGYLQFALYKNKKKRNFYAHVLGMTAFVPKPSNCTEVNHKNEFDKTDNFIFVNPDGSVDLEKSSLEWCTHSQNMNYGTAVKRQTEKVTNGKVSKKVLQYDLEGNLIATYPSLSEIQRTLRFSKGQISKGCRGIVKAPYGFVWCYA